MKPAHECFCFPVKSNNLQIENSGLSSTSGVLELNLHPATRGLRLKHLMLMLIFFASLTLKFALYNYLDLHFDETYYAGQSYDLMRGKFIPWTYTHPPLLMFLMSANYRIFGVSVLSTRLPSMLLGSLTVFATYLLGSSLYNSEVGIIAALLIGFSFITQFFGLLAFIETALTFFAVLSCYFYIKWLNNRKPSDFALMVVLLGLTLDTKAVGIFLPLIIALHFLIFHRKSSHRNMVRLTMFGTCLFVLSISPSLVLANSIIHNAQPWNQPWKASFGPISYVVAMSVAYLRLYYYLSMPLLFVFFLIGLVFSFTRIKDVNQWLLILWLAGFIVVLAYQAHARWAWDHYIVPSIPPLSILSASFLARIRRFLQTATCLNFSRLGKVRHRGLIVNVFTVLLMVSLGAEGIVNVIGVLDSPWNYKEPNWILSGSFGVEGGFGLSEAINYIKDHRSQSQSDFVIITEQIRDRLAVGLLLNDRLNPWVETTLEYAPPLRSPSDEPIDGVFEHVKPAYRAKNESAELLTEIWNSFDRYLLVRAGSPLDKFIKSFRIQIEPLRVFSHKDRPMTILYFIPAKPYNFSILFDFFHARDPRDNYDKIKYLRTPLSQANYKMKINLDPLTTSNIKNYDMIVVSGRTGMFSDFEINAVLDYVRRGGILMMCGSEDLGSINLLASNFGIRFEGNMIQGPIKLNRTPFGADISDFVEGKPFVGYPMFISVGDVLAWANSQPVLVYKNYERGLVVGYGSSDFTSANVEIGSQFFLRLFSVIHNLSRLDNVTNTYVGW